MREAEQIWRFGKWIARRTNGAARLGWTDGEVVLRVIGGRVVSAEGLDTSAIAGDHDQQPLGSSDLLVEAVAVARRYEIPETQALGSAKLVIERAVRAWILDPQRQLELVEGDPDGVEGPTISATHAIVEMILSETDTLLPSLVLPDRDVVLRRTTNFLELYAPLRLSEDADLIVARISGQRTAAEIASSSPHSEREVIRLLAALVATGMLEAAPTAPPMERLELAHDFSPDDEPGRRRFAPAWLIGVAFVVVVLLGVVAFLIARSGSSPVATQAGGGGRWSLVIDMGCEPQDLQRILKKANQHSRDVRAMRVDPEQNEPCWRLLWGDFASSEAAHAEIGAIPAALRRDGFQPHAIPVETRDESSPASGS